MQTNYAKSDLRKAAGMLGCSVRGRQALFALHNLIEQHIIALERNDYLRALCLISAAWDGEADSVLTTIRDTLTGHGYEAFIDDLEASG